LGFGIFAIAALLYLAPLLLNAPLTDPDEGLHAAISQEMLEHGDLIVPRFLGRAFLDKPILFFWAQAASITTFGMNTAAARLPGMLFALLGIATTGWLARTLFDAHIGWIAAACYATMVLPFLLAQAPVHDIALVPFTNLALGFLWRARWDLGLGIWDLGFAAIALGLSMLTKGLEGVAIVGLGYGVYLLLARAMTLRIVLQGVTVLAIAALVALPWYLAMDAREPGYLRYYFIDRHLFGFATDTQRHSGQPWWFYLPIVIGGGLPWIVYVVLAARKAPPYTAVGRVLWDPPTIFLWTWLVGAIILLSLSASKAVTYVLPAMPAIAILAARSPKTARAWLTPAVATAAVYVLALAVFGPSAARAHSARDLADYFNSAGRLPGTIFVFDRRVSFVYYLQPSLRNQLNTDQVRSVSVEQLAAMQPFPRDAVVTVPGDLAESRLSRIPALAHAARHAAGRYVVVSP
jgi:4-amino-4-deoxy-L-arabinose transferase-like glycosyltransferase